MAKISQIKLTNTNYDIDVANSLKATKILGEEATSKVVTIQAAQKPDGQNNFFDENNKISSHYISDTILGQLKFGGTIDSASQSDEDRITYQITPSSHLISKISELVENDVTETGIVFLAKDFVTALITIACLKSDYGQIADITDVGDALDGFYFISGCSHDGYAVHRFAPTFNVGDWVIVAGSSLQKIDNTDTITHIDETAGTSLLEITGSSGLKLNHIIDSGLTGLTFDTKLTAPAFSSTTSSMNSSLSTEINESGFIQSGRLFGSGNNAGVTISNGSINIWNGASESLSDKLNISTEKIQFRNVSDAVSTEVSKTNVKAANISAITKMTAPTITDVSDKTQVVNLDYFENNATKVDWENIDSEVHVINNHSVEIDGGLVVHCNSDITRVDISSLADEQTCAYEPYVQSDGTTSWYNDSNLTAPYWLKFPITAGYEYEVTLKPEYMNSSSSFFKNDAAGAGHLVVTAASEGATLNVVEYSYAASAQDVEYSTSWSGKGTIYFTADITGYAYISTGNSVMYNAGDSVYVSMYNITEIRGSVARAKIEGDLEVTGDLSFGADSHLVFGTIEGTDFIADHAKVKNAPTEADDVVNKAYFDANKGGGTGIPAPEETSELPSELNSDYLVLSDIGEVNNLDWSTGTYTGILDPKATYELYLEAADGTWIKGILPTVSGSEMNNVHFQVTDYTAMTCMNTGWVNGTNKSTNYVFLDNITRRADGFYDLQISFNNCCWQPVKVTITKTGGTTPVSMDGAFLRWRNGQAVWEMLSNAEDNTF